MSYSRHIKPSKNPPDGQGSSERLSTAKSDEHNVTSPQSSSPALVKIMRYISAPGVNNTYECFRCHKQYWNLQNIRRHVLLDCDTKRYRCEKCHVLFSHWSTFWPHVENCESSPPTKPKENMTHPPKPQASRRFACDYPTCNKSFETQNALDQHIKTHTSERFVKCDHCPRVFTRFYNLRSHEMNVHGHEETSNSLKIPLSKFAGYESHDDYVRHRRQGENSRRAPSRNDTSFGHKERRPKTRSDGDSSERDEIDAGSKRSSFNDRLYTKDPTGNNFTPVPISSEPSRSKIPTTLTNLPVRSSRSMQRTNNMSLIPRPSRTLKSNAPKSTSEAKNTGAQSASRRRSQFQPVTHRSSRPTSLRASPPLDLSTLFSPPPPSRGKSRIRRLTLSSIDKSPIESSSSASSTTSSSPPATPYARARAVYPKRRDKAPYRTSSDLSLGRARSSSTGPPPVTMTTGRPPSRASSYGSYGSANSGASHPPRAHRLKKPVKMSYEEFSAGLGRRPSVEAAALVEAWAQSHSFPTSSDPDKTAEKKRAYEYKGSRQSLISYADRYPLDAGAESIDQERWSMHGVTDRYLDEEVLRISAAAYSRKLHATSDDARPRAPPGPYHRPMTPPTVKSDEGKWPAVREEVKARKKSGQRSGKSLRRTHSLK